MERNLIQKNCLKINFYLIILPRAKIGSTNQILLANTARKYCPRYYQSQNGFGT